MLQAARNSLSKSTAQIPNLRSASLASHPYPLIRQVPLADHLPHVPQSRGTHSRPLSTELYPISPQIDLVPAPLPLPQFGFAPRRAYSGGGSVDYTKEVDEINLKFAEAREDIEAALESKETVYFNEEAECARDSVKAALGMYQDLGARLPEKERGVLQRSMGLKMEQLKAELLQLDE